MMISRNLKHNLKVTGLAWFGFLALLLASFVWDAFLRVKAGDAFHLALEENVWFSLHIAGWVIMGMILVLAHEKGCHTKRRVILASINLPFAAMAYAFLVYAYMMEVSWFIL